MGRTSNLTPEERKEHQRNYNRDYYARNRKIILAGKKERYDNDPEYRKRVRESQKTRYDTRFKISSRVDVRIKAAKDGRVLYSIGLAAEMANTTDSTLRSYHMRGIIPDTGTYDNKGWRLYSPHQIKVIKAAIKRKRAMGLNTEQLQRYIEDRWR